MFIQENLEDNSVYGAKKEVTLFTLGCITFPNKARSRKWLVDVMTPFFLKVFMEISAQLG